MQGYLPIRRLVLVAALAAAAAQVGPLGAREPQGPDLPVNNATIYIVRGTCAGNGTFSGQGSSEAYDPQANTFTLSSGTFQGSGTTTSTGGVWNGRWDGPNPRLVFGSVHITLASL